MKLYYSAGSCSTSCHIAMEEAGLAYDGVEVSWDKDQNVAELEALNPLGTAPVMVLDDGKVLSQNVSILEYIADQAPAKNLLPAKGTADRALAVNWLSFVATDLHKSFLPLFYAPMMTESKEAQDGIKKFARENVSSYLKYVDTNLSGRDYLTGSTFTVADAYLFVVTSWCKWQEIDTKQFANVTAFMKRVYERPAVQKSLKALDLIEDIL